AFAPPARRRSAPPPWTWRAAKRRCSRPQSFRPCRNDAGYWSCVHHFLGLGDRRSTGQIADHLAAKADIGLGALWVLAELFQDRQDDPFLAILVAANAHADHDLGIDALFHRPDDADDFLGAGDVHLDLDDGAHHLFVQDVGTDVAGLDIAHQGGDGVV